MKKNGAIDAESQAGLYLALIHHPVINRRGEVITSAVTNLDLHDISRAARTYGVKAVFCVTPLEDQKELIGRLVEHWTQGYGATHNPDRRQALELLHISASLAEAVTSVTAIEDQAPAIVATSARRQAASIDCGILRQRLMNGVPQLLLFGTASGLAPETIAASDDVLEPVEGIGPYNHLSVRSAASIILDRVAGR